MHTPDSLTPDQKLVVMAAAVHGLGPETALKYANARRVVRLSLIWKGFSGHALEAAWNPYDGSAVLNEIYRAMISLMPHESDEPLLEGAGNVAGNPPAFPDFTSCRLTALGMELAEQLLSERPDLRDSVADHREPRRLEDHPNDY